MSSEECGINIMMGKWTIYHYRLSEVIVMICIPATFFLSIQIAFLSRDVKNAPSASGSLLDIEVSYKTVEDYSLNMIPDEDIVSLTLSPKEQIFVAPPLNNTGKSEDRVMILTSIPRSGQSNLREIIKAIKGNNKFLTISPPRKPELTIEVPSSDKQRTVVERVSSINFSAAIIDHFAFIDFRKFGKKQPIQVSLIRDPVERAISNYYFVRAPFTVVEENHRFPAKSLPNRKFLRKSMESCLLNEDDNECSFKKDSPIIGHTVQFFCGQDDFCRLFGNEEGLQRAMKNVEENFSVVGVVEELEKTLIVLENYVPKFFKGAFNTYRELKRRDPSALTNKNVYKPGLESHFKKILSQRFSVERKFYDFIKQRLNKQYDKLLERAKIKEKFNNYK